MMNPPTLSILLPCRNMQSTLTEALGSIVNQSFREFELVIIDDHSQDHSIGIVKQFNDARFKVFQNVGNGLVDALNLGMEKCRCDWVVRMDGDDIMHPQRLEQLWRATTDFSEADLIASQVKMFPHGEIQKGYREYIRWQNKVLSSEQISQQIYVESPFSHPSVMFRKSVVLELGGYHKGHFPEDYELWLRMHEANRLMIKLPVVLLYWRESPDRFSRNHEIYSRESFDRLRAKFLARDQRLCRNRALAFWGAGRKTRKRSELLMEYGFSPVAWIDIDPKKINNIIKGVPVVDPMWLAGPQPKPFVLSYVTNHGAREKISAELNAMEYKPGTDYLMVG